MPGFANRGGGRGFWGWGRGGGGGGRRRQPNRFWAAGPQPAVMPPPVGYAGPAVPAATREQELDALKGQAGYLEDSLEGIKKRIEELESAVSGKTEA